MFLSWSRRASSSHNNVLLSLLFKHSADLVARSVTSHYNKFIRFPIYATSRTTATSSASPTKKQSSRTKAVVSRPESTNSNNSASFTTFLASVLQPDEAPTQPIVKAPAGFWSNFDNHKRFLDWAGLQLGITHHEQWYSIPRTDIFKLGGGALLVKFYQGSLQNALAAVYPEQEWLPWRFKQTKRFFWKDLKNQRSFFDWAGRQLNIENLDGWYEITTEQVSRLGGGGLISWYYNGSLHRALAAVYPSHDWLPWRFAQTGKGFWPELAHQKMFLDWAGKQLGITEDNLDGWYDVRRDDIDKLGGSAFLSEYYNDSLQQALFAVYPQHEWLPWKFKQVHGSFWVDVANQKMFFEWAGKQLGVNDLDDWYNVTSDDVLSLGGQRLIRGYYACPPDRSYSSSLHYALSVIYPQHEWLPWRFHKVANTYWQEPANQKRFLDWAGAQLGVKHLDDWYGISVASIEKLGGYGLLDGYYGGSLQQALFAVYPQHEWLPWKFHHIGKGFWPDLANQRMFLDWAGKQLGIDTDNGNNLDGWYSCAVRDVEMLGGGTLMGYYNNSLRKALTTVYPEYEWQLWRFQLFDITTIDDLKPYVEHLAEGLGIKQLDNWYRVSQQQLVQVGGYRAQFIIKKHGGLYAMLRKLYPNHAWQANLFEHNKGKKSAQRWLLVVLRQLFPNNMIIEEYMHPTLRFTKSGRNVTLDMYIPDYSLAFEYQGEQHYRDIRCFNDDVRSRKEREAEKSVLCEKGGITLVSVPYWWNRTVEDLAATIREHRPDLFEFDPATAVTHAVYDRSTTTTTTITAAEREREAVAEAEVVKMRLEAAAKGIPIPQQRPPTTTTTIPVVVADSQQLRQQQ